MHGVVSLLDDEHYRIVEELWVELEHEFDARGVYITPYPHFSYQVATHYDVEQLEPILEHIAANSVPFQVQTSGLGIFTGSKPVLYIAMARSPKLTRYHQEIWAQISRAGAGIQDYYHPDFWMPHITIGFGDVDTDRLGRIVHHLGQRNFSWNITIDNIALIYDNGTRQELRMRCDFKNAGRKTI